MIRVMAKGFKSSPMAVSTKVSTGIIKCKEAANICGRQEKYMRDSGKITLKTAQEPGKINKVTAMSGSGRTDKLKVLECTRRPKAVATRDSS